MYFKFTFHLFHFIFRTWAKLKRSKTRTFLSLRQFRQQGNQKPIRWIPPLHLLRSFLSDLLSFKSRLHRQDALFTHSTFVTSRGVPLVDSKMILARAPRSTHTKTVISTTAAFKAIGRLSESLQLIFVINQWISHFACLTTVNLFLREFSWLFVLSPIIFYRFENVFSCVEQSEQVVEPRRGHSDSSRVLIRRWRWRFHGDFEPIGICFFSFGAVPFFESLEPSL